MEIGANRGRNDNRRRLRDDVAQGQPVNRLVPANHHRQPVYSDDSEDEEALLFNDHRPARSGGKHARDNDMDGGDFRLKVDFLYFSGNLNIEDFIDWLA